MIKFIHKALVFGLLSAPLLSSECLGADSVSPVEWPVHNPGLLLDTSEAAALALSTDAPSDLDGSFGILEMQNTAEQAELARVQRVNQELVEAVTYRNAAAVRSLIEQGAQLDAAVVVPLPQELAAKFVSGWPQYYLAKEEGLTPIMLAALLDDLEMMRLLVELGANPHLRTQRNKSFAIQFAARHNNVSAMQLLLGVTLDSDAARMRLDVNLAAQSMTLYRDGSVLIYSDISSGKPAKPTPTGRFVVTDKWKNWISTIYKVKMPWFLRLSCSEVGLHAGRLPGYPASSGCIRLPSGTAKELFSLVPIGTEVVIF